MNIQNKILTSKIKSLENENALLKKQCKGFETELKYYKNNETLEQKDELLKQSIAEAEYAKQTYDELNQILKDKIKEVNKLLKQSKILVEKQGVNFEKQVNKEIQNLTSIISG